MTDETAKPKLLDAGRRLMLARGYAATSIDRVCREVGVSKGSFYHFFESKEEFGLAVLEGYYEEGVGRVMAGDFAGVADPRERMEGFFDHLEAVAPELWEHGCLMGSFAGELAESSPTIHARVGELFDHLVQRMAALFRGVVDDADRAETLAEELLMLLEGSIVLARAHHQPSRIADAVRRFRCTLETRMAGAGAAGPD